MSNKDKEYPSIEKEVRKVGKLTTQVARAFNVLNDKIEEIETENRKLKADLQRCYDAARASWPEVRKMAIAQNAYLFREEDGPHTKTDILLNHIPWLIPLKQIFDLAYVDNLRNNPNKEQSDPESC
jgi:predicted RNase H-like nuclease (RuvC/YqgF family)